jgi:hypothetical protein
MKFLIIVSRSGHRTCPDKYEAKEYKVTSECLIIYPIENNKEVVHLPLINVQKFSIFEE